MKYVLRMIFCRELVELAGRPDRRELPARRLSADMRKSATAKSETTLGQALSSFTPSPSDQLKGTAPHLQRESVVLEHAISSKTP